MTLHTQARAQGRWLSAGELEQATKGGQYALHSQSVQALCQKFAANVETATELRRQELAETGHLQTPYPHHPKAYQTVVWKDQALTIFLGLFAPAHRRAAAARCCCRCPTEYQQSQSAPGGVDLAGGSL